MENFLVILFVFVLFVISLIPPLKSFFIRKEMQGNCRWAHGLKNGELKKEKSLLEENLTSLSKKEYRRYLVCFAEYNSRFRSLDWWKANADMLSDEELKVACMRYADYLYLIEIKDYACMAICEFLKGQLQKRSLK